MEDNSKAQNEKNKNVVTAGAAEMGMAIILLIVGGIGLVLGLFRVHIPTVLKILPTIGFFLSLGWVVVSWNLIQSADKTKDIRQRRRWFIYWGSYSVIIAILNIAVIIYSITILILKHYGRATFIVTLVIAVIILVLRGFIFVTVTVFYSKELLQIDNNKSGKSSKKIQGGGSTGVTEVQVSNGHDRPPPV